MDWLDEMLQHVTETLWHSMMKCALRDGEEAEVCSVNQREKGEVVKEAKDDGKVECMWDILC